MKKHVLAPTWYMLDTKFTIFFHHNFDFQFQRIYRVCHRFRLAHQDDYFLVAFKASVIFLCSWGSSENQLEPKTLPQ